MISFDQFITKWDGKVLDTDQAYGGQCMDEMHGHLNQVLDLPLSLFAAPTAYQAWLNANDPRFDKILNTPTGVPVKGDIMFWKPNVSGVTGSAGHVASFISGDVNSFVSFDQNYPTGSPCSKQSHSYAGVVGWLHFKSQPISEVEQLRKENAQLKKDKDDLVKQLDDAKHTISLKDDKINKAKVDLS